MSSSTSKQRTSRSYGVWESEDGLLRMMEFEPEYVRERISTELKDKAKDRGFLFWHDGKIVLTDDPKEYGTKLETFGLEQYLQMRIGGSL